MKWICLCSTWMKERWNGMDIKRNEAHWYGTAWHDDQMWQWKVGQEDPRDGCCKRFQSYNWIVFHMKAVPSVKTPAMVPRVRWTTKTTTQGDAFGHVIAEARPLCQGSNKCKLPLTGCLILFWVQENTPQEIELSSKVILQVYPGRGASEDEWAGEISKGQQAASNLYNTDTAQTGKPLALIGLHLARSITLWQTDSILNLTPLKKSIFKGWWNFQMKHVCSKVTETFSKRWELAQSSRTRVPKSSWAENSSLK